ncbi:MAG: hypothetical protein AMXMBFR81_12890 [Chthonomonas sp.]
MCDALGRVTRESNRGLATQYEYDQNGNRTLMVDPSGGRFTYLYDEVDRLKSMQVPTGQRYTQQYDADSRRTTLLLGLGSKRRYEYDSVGRVTTHIEFDSSNQRIYTMVDSYDAVGNRTGRNTNGNPTTWLYDDAYRLIGQEKSGQTATFSYDENSNLVLKHHQGGNPRTIAYDVADRITTYQEGSALTTLSWQGRGAMHTQKTGADTTTFTYSDPMFLTAVDGPSGRLATYVYDSESKRRRIYEGAAFTTLVWDGWDYLQWRRPSGTHVFHTMNREIVGESVGGVVRDYLLDPLGSVVATLDSDGLVDQFEYWPTANWWTTCRQARRCSFGWAGSAIGSTPTSAATCVTGCCGRTWEAGCSWIPCGRDLSNDTVAAMPGPSCRAPHTPRRLRVSEIPPVFAQRTSSAGRSRAARSPWIARSCAYGNTFGTICPSASESAPRDSSTPSAFRFVFGRLGTSSFPAVSVAS